MTEYPNDYKKLSPLNVDEPTFTIRAKDNFAVPILRLIQNIYGISNEVIEWFERWRKNNPDKCKDPD